MTPPAAWTWRAPRERVVVDHTVDIEEDRGDFHERRSIAELRWQSCLSHAAFGVYEHIAENHKPGPLDYRYAATWESLSATDQWWKAATKAVGPAPILAAGVLAQAGLMIAAATVGHPASKRAG